MTINIIEHGLEGDSTSGTSLLKGESVTMFAKVEYSSLGEEPITDTAKLLINGEQIDSKQFTVQPPSKGSGYKRVTFTTSFDSGGSKELRINIPKSQNRTSVSSNVFVADKFETESGQSITAGSTSSSDGRTSILQDERDPVKIAVEQPSDNSKEVELGKYIQPDISIDSGTKFAEHDTVGGPTIRQKTGEEPREMTINGACTEKTATELHDLSQNNLFSVTSSVKNFDFAQLVSVSTQPMNEGGALDLDGEFLHTYTMKFIEVRNRRE